MTTFNDYIEAHEDDLRDQWESMGMVERFEEGGTFEKFCEEQFQDEE